jgi:uncharacterized protein (TIGR01777 family)
MKVVLAGGSGFLGRALHAALRDAGHDVLVLTRRPRPDVGTDRPWTPDGTAGPWASALDAVDAVVNLAGEGIADKRWTAARKLALRDSRLLATRSLTAALRLCTPRPRVVLTSSAIGYYGAHGDEPVTEQSPPGADFLAQLCVEWEREAVAPASPGTRVAIVRTGIVLHPRGGALKSMLPPFRLGIGGPMGTGRQYMAWIHLLDWLGMVRWILERPALSGVFNATAPTPVTNRDFARALGRALHRPAIAPAPGFALRIMFGEFASFLLTGARVLPASAQAQGYQFRFATLDDALRDLLR